MLGCKGLNMITQGIFSLWETLSSSNLKSATDTTSLKERLIVGRDGVTRGARVRSRKDLVERPI